jgi:phage minor structural protein
MNDYIYIFDEQQNPVSILSNELPNACPYNEDIKTERLEKGLLTFEFSVPMSHPDAATIVNEGFVIRPNEEEEGSFELFRIKIDDTKKSTKFKYVVGENAAVTDLIGQIIRPNPDPDQPNGIYPSKTIEQIMEIILQNTGWQLGRVDYSGVQDFTFNDYPTALGALHKVMEQFEAEVKFRVEFSGTTITGKYIDMLRRRGDNTGKIFSYGYDLTDEVQRVIDTNDLVTALIGIGPNDSDGKPMTFANYHPTVPSGYEKQLDWIGNIEARERWGDQGKHIFGVYQDNDAENQVDLYNKTKAKLDELSKPRYTYNVGVLLLEKLTGYEAHRVSVGDNIQVQDKTFSPPLLLEARVIEKKTSKKDRTKDTVTLGEFVPVLSTTPTIIQQTQTQNRGVAGGHVVVYGPTQDDMKGFYGQSNESITIEVTNEVHLGYTSIFTAEEISSGLVELRDANNNVIESRTFAAADLVPVPDSVYEYVLKLNFVLTPSIGTYKLWGSFDGQTFVRLPDEISFPYDSGEFKIIGTSDPDGYYWHFFKLQVAGSGVLGGSNQTFTVGDLSNNFSAFRSLNAVGEETARIDNEQASFAVLNAGIINSESVVSYSDEDFTFYINAVTGDDENDGQTSETALASFARAMQLTPKLCDGNVTIYIESDVVEDIVIAGYMGLNAITIYGGTRTGAGAPYTYSHRTIVADMNFDGTTKRINFFYGKYFPRTHRAGTSGATNFGSKTQYVYMRECYVSANVPGTTNYNTNAVGWNDNGYIHLSHCYLQDWGTNAIRAASRGHIHLEACAGSTVNTAARVGEATIGGAITFQGGTNLLTNQTTPGYPQSGSGVTSNYIITSVGGLINGVTTATGTNGAGGTKGTPPSTTTTTTIYNSLDTGISGRSYRTTKYVGWRMDEINVREGDYGYGDHKGLWFFGGTMPATPPWVGKTIEQIWVELQRDVEGGAPGHIRITTHNYLTIPSGNPTIGSSFVTAYFDFNTKKAVRLDLNTAIKNAFVNNTAKGIAIAGNPYAIMKVAAKLIVKWR